MSDICDIYFKASLQNTLNPEVGTFDNVGNKEGTFTLEDGEYYLTNNTRTSYRVYYPTRNIYSTGCTVEFDVNYSHTGGFDWCLLFNGDDSTYWYGFGVDSENLQFRGATLSNYHIVNSPSTWLHVKCIFNRYDNQTIVHIYIDNVEATNFSISNNYGIKYIDILGNSGGFAPAGVKIKNIIIYNNSKKHYLDTTGLISLWSKIKSLFATKPELASKANDSDVAHKSGDETIAGTKTFTSTIVGNVTGTATKLATARTIALSGAAIGTATGFDGSGNITIPVTALAPWAIRNKWYAAYPDGAEAHNAMWGGRDITDAFDDGTFSTNVANGTFRDIFPGDYITKQVTISGKARTVNWVITDCDYWINKGGNPAVTAHHVAIVPQVSIFNAWMNQSRTTEGGYAGSDMYKKTIPAIATGIVDAFGYDHILTFDDYLTRDLNTSAVYSQKCNLMSEAMVYNGSHFASSALDNIVATRQMSAFRLSERLINSNRQFWWLRDVVSSSDFAAVEGNGTTGSADASNVYGEVRPFALLK